MHGCLLQGGVAVGAGVHQQRAHVAVQRHLALRGHLGGESVDGNVDAVAAHPPPSTARWAHAWTWSK